MKQDHLEALLEQIASQNKAVLEAVGDIQSKVAVLPRIEQRLDTLESDMQVVKAAVPDLSRQVDGIEHRVTRLEAA